VIARTGMVEDVDLSDGSYVKHLSEVSDNGFYAKSGVI
jgi:hypothetical protein